MTKRRSSEFSALKWKLFPKKCHSKIWSANIFFRPPKLGAKSPPMHYPHKPPPFYSECSSLFCCILKKTKHFHIAPVLKTFHWHKIPEPIQSKYLNQQRNKLSLVLPQIYDSYELTKGSSLAIFTQVFHSKLKSLLYNKS